MEVANDNRKHDLKSSHNLWGWFSFSWLALALCGWSDDIYIGGSMKVGDKVVSSTNPDNSEIAIIIGINDNGDCKVQFRDGVYLIHPRWLEVIS